MLMNFKGQTRIELVRELNRLEKKLEIRKEDLTLASESKRRTKRLIESISLRIEQIKEEIELIDSMSNADRVAELNEQIVDIKSRLKEVMATKSRMILKGVDVYHITNEIYYLRQQIIERENEIDSRKLEVIEIDGLYYYTILDSNYIMISEEQPTQENYWYLDDIESFWDDKNNLEIAVKNYIKGKVA